MTSTMFLLFLVTQLGRFFTGNRALAARLLGISRTALYQKLERFRLS